MKVESTITSSLLYLENYVIKQHYSEVINIIKSKSIDGKETLMKLFSH